MPQIGFTCLYLWFWSYSTLSLIFWGNISSNSFWEITSGKHLNSCLGLTPSLIQRVNSDGLQSISTSYSSGCRDRNEHRTLIRSVRDRTWALFQLLCKEKKKKKLNSFPWEPFCCHVEVPCSDVKNKDEVNTQKDEQRETKEWILVTTRWAPAWRLNQSQSWVFFHLKYNKKS